MNYLLGFQIQPIWNHGPGRLISLDRSEFWSCQGNHGTGLSMEFDKIHLKEAIVTWPDMHSFRYFDNFESSDLIG